MHQLFENPSSREARLQLVDLGALWDMVLTDLHEEQLSGHLGVEKTLARVTDSTGLAITKMCRLVWQMCNLCHLEEPYPLCNGTT